MIKYIGSKRTLIPQIVRAVEAFPDNETVLDLFSGTSRVGQALKSAGKFVHANDHLTYAATIATCYVQVDADERLKEASALIEELSHVKPKAGYFTETFCENARYFQPKNGAKIDAIRDEIESRSLDPELKAIALVSLMEAADRVDSTTGVQMAYLKSWATRAHKDLEFRVPELLKGNGRASQLEAVDAAKAMKVDVAYLDPPYNQHSYMGNYHIWETLVRWDAPEAYGIAQKRIECREYKSDFNSKRRIADAMQTMIDALRCKHALVSFSNEGHLNADEMVEMLSVRGHVGVASVDFKRYVGAQIGIYNPKGDKVGRVSHLRNKENFFVVSEDESVVQRVLHAITTDETCAAATEAS